MAVFLRRTKCEPLIIIFSKHLYTVTCARGCECGCSMQSGNLAQSADCTVQSADCTVAVRSADCMPCSLQTARPPFQWECFGEITSKKTERIVMIL